MADYVLSRRADRDLDEIYLYTEDNFGERQADAYAAALLKRLDELAASPELGRIIDVEAVACRRFDHREHCIFYRIERRYIRIVRILHRRMLPKRHL